MFFYLTAAIVIVFCIYCLIVWVRDANRFVTVTYEIESEKIRKPYCFALLSDLHNKAYGAQNRRLAQAVQALPLDGIIVAGDMYTAKKGTGFQNALALFEQLAGKAPIYYANGNHEQKTRMRPQDYGTMYADYLEELGKLGIEPMVNGRVTLPEYGIDLCTSEIGAGYFAHFKRREFPEGYLTELVGEPNRNAYQILAAHNPDYFDEYAAWGADLVLSGHIHGGVVRLPFLGGVISPSIRFFPKYDGGRYEIGSSAMVLGRGLGMHTVPVRVWNPGELVMVRLKPKKDGAPADAE